MDEDIGTFLESQKKEFESTRREAEERISRRREELENQYNRKMDELKRELESKRLEIVEQGEAKATTIRLDISDKEIEKIVFKVLNEYLEG